jgi:hypothetical protein
MADSISSSAIDSGTFEIQSLVDGMSIPEEPGMALVRKGFLPLTVR